ncbi:lysine--tRNA ligase [Candidatus Nomurabacteria bacterium]|nr:lysine--tRNA ligase [Candidatus Kaiserbacteria bacterium]MCB9810129.1 lysine--tRNA ligase [Candidatus Nomurabacteria bacterium]MCB9818527.1 lysine--tRNA ligase [Candidatus Nomurabacteria bacterium]
MFWADTITDEVEKRYADKIKAGEAIVVRDEKTASGQVHVGSLRSASLHAIVADVLRSRGVNVNFFFEINDFDPMDGIPSYLDEEIYKKYMGVPLCNIPSPEVGFDNFAEYYGQEYVRVLDKIGFGATVYRASELYRSGAMNDLIKMALKKKDLIREIYYRISKSEKPEGWYPINVICERCGNLSATNVTDFDGELVTYTCSSDTIKWAEGCGHSGKISPYNGNAKFPWKIDWPAKFVAKGVDFEGGGKDHYTKGGSRQVAETIAREVFEHEPPYGVFNEFFLVGGKKMSSSKGNAATAVEMSTILPPHILRLLLLKIPINRQLDFDPEGDAIPILFDNYDRLAEKYWSGVKDDDTQLFNFIHLPDERGDLPQRFLPRFSQVAFLVQMPHMDTYKEVEKMKESELTDVDIAELDMRITYAKHWLADYADDKFIFTLQETIPEIANTLTEEEKKATTQLAEKISQAEVLDGASLHELIHEVKEESGLSPKEFFGAIYKLFLGKESGPKVGWFLSTLGKEFVVSRLRLEK